MKEKQKKLRQVFEKREESISNKELREEQKLAIKLAGICATISLIACFLVQLKKYMILIAVISLIGMFIFMKEIFQIVNLLYEREQQCKRKEILQRIKEKDFSKIRIINEKFLAFMGKYINHPLEIQISYHEKGEILLLIRSSKTEEILVNEYIKEEEILSFFDIQ